MKRSEIHAALREMEAASMDTHFGSLCREDRPACGFYGADQADVPAVNDLYPGIRTPRELYRALSELWCAETCAPRMRERWTPENRTLGQCSITAFLAQDIFGGKVYGIPLGDGAVHCYNAVGDCVFDLTCEQFGARANELAYENNPEQCREVHFSKAEKRRRYERLCQMLTNWCENHP